MSTVFTYPIVTKADFTGCHFTLYSKFTEWDGMREEGRGMGIKIRKVKRKCVEWGNGWKEEEMEGRVKKEKRRGEGNKGNRIKVREKKPLETLISYLCFTWSTLTVSLRNTFPSLSVSPSGLGSGLGSVAWLCYNRGAKHNKIQYFNMWTFGGMTVAMKCVWHDTVWRQ